MINKICILGFLVFVAISINVLCQDQTKSLLQRVKELEEQNQKLLQENIELKKQILEQMEKRILNEQLSLLQERMIKLEQENQQFKSRITSLEEENSISKARNILKPNNREKFIFSCSHQFTPEQAHPKNVCSEVDRETADEWYRYGIHQNIGSGTGWWKVDLLKPHRAHYIVIVGYPTGSHYPKELWLEGSNDNSNWKTIHTFAPSHDGIRPPPDWHFHGGPYADGRSWNDVKNQSQGEWVRIDQPDFYRYYRLSGSGWNISNGYMLIMNIGLFVE